MLGISVLLLCCYGLYSSFEGGRVTAERPATSFEQVLTDDQRRLTKSSSAHPKKALIGNKIKNLCVSFFTPKRKNDKNEVNAIAAKNAAVRSVSLSISQGKLPKRLYLPSNSLTSSYKSSPSKFLKASLPYHTRRGDEYFLTKYDVNFSKEANELIKWQSVKSALSKNESLQYKSALDKLNSDHLSKKLCCVVRKASGVVLSLHEKHRLLNKEESALIGQLSNAHSLDLQSGVKHLSTLDEVLSKIPVLMPQDCARITSHFGKRSHKRRIRDHKGIDMTSPEAIVYAAADGKVEFCGWHQGYGNLVVINHGRFITKYAHLRKVCVSNGDFVTQGKKIAFEGATGNARGRHLHFEVLCSSGEHLDPMEFIIHSMKVAQKINSDKVFALQRLKCSSSVLASNASVIKGKSSSKRGTAFDESKINSDSRVFLVVNEKTSTDKKVARVRRVATSKRGLRPLKHAHVNKPLITQEAAIVAPKKSFFGTLYRAILPW